MKVRLADLRFHRTREQAHRNPYRRDGGSGGQFPLSAVEGRRLAHQLATLVPELPPVQHGNFTPSPHHTITTASPFSIGWRCSLCDTTRRYLHKGSKPESGMHNVQDTYCDRPQERNSRWEDWVTGTDNADISQMFSSGGGTAIW